jgi:hypothetical protein
MTTTVRSTTGTAPIAFERISADLVLIILEDGSQQIYRVTEILAALNQGY